MTEADLQRSIIEYARAVNCMVFRMNAGRGRQNQRLCPAGTPDLQVIDRYGQTWWVEVKGPSGKLRAEQETMIRELEARQQVVIVARELEDVTRRIQ